MMLGLFICPSSIDKFLFVEILELSNLNAILALFSFKISNT